MFTDTPFDHEQLIARRGRRSGVHAIVAVHSTALGPALGGCRMWHYETTGEGVADALRLSSAMTLKAAAAGLDLGGGKGVIALPPGLDPAGPLRKALLLDFADIVNQLGGAYITAEDVGTSADDMVEIASVSSYVVGLPASHGGAGNPSHMTAVGVRAAMRACCRRLFGAAELRDRSVAVVGAGHVGEQLARLLAADGAKLVLSDVDEHKRALALELGAGWLDPEQALRASVDVLAPCALGGILDPRSTESLRCRVVCGSANNQLADESVAELLAARGILYAPDFIVNAGGLISSSADLEGSYDRMRVEARVAALEEQLDRILTEAARYRITPLAAAIKRAQSRLLGGAARNGKAALVRAAS